jgi:glycosyltransferase involved in cell wall biosynthesis
VHVLVLPSWYRTLETPWNGAFFESQALALARGGARVGVAFVEPRSLRSLSPSRLRESHFQIEYSVERGVTTLRMKGWNTLGQTGAGAKVWCALSKRLVNAYVHSFGVPDVLHAHAALWAGRVAVRMGRTLSRPCVVTEHSSQILLGVLGRKERREAARVYREADAVLAVSDPLLAAVGSIAGARLGRVVPNTVDFEFFTLPTIPRRREPFTFLSACNLVSGKRVDRLIRAFARVSRTCPCVRLVIVGAGPEARHLQRLAEESGVAPQVEFTGGMPREGVRERMWNANTLVLPSSFETFGVVLVEALATGLPVISTRCGGPEDIVESGLGLLVERDDEEGLVGAMVTMTHQYYSDSMLRNRVMGHYSFETVAQQLLRVYATLQTQGR